MKGVVRFQIEVIQRLLERDPAQRFQTAAETEEFLASFEAHLNSPRQNRQPRLARVKRPTNYRRCLIALAITLVFALSFTAFNSWQAKTGLFPMIQFISCDSIELKGANKEDTQLSKQKDER